MIRKYETVQIPQLLNKSFNNFFVFKQTFIPELSPFIVAQWDIRPKLGAENTKMKNVILPDGCIDLVVAFTDHQIGFTGMSKTAFDFEDDSSKQFFGFRMMPGTFHALTGLHASLAMDNFYDAFVFLNLDDSFWNLDFDEAINTIQSKLQRLIINIEVSPYMNHFLYFLQDTPKNAESVSEYLGYSTKQSNRYFMLNYGLSIKQILSVIRLQKALKILSNTPDIQLSILAYHLEYYDQSHFTNDITSNLGVTPKQLIQLFKQ